MTQPESTARGPGRFRPFVHIILTHWRFPMFLAVLAAILTLPSITAGLVFDDYHAKLCILRIDSPVTLMDSPIDLFSFLKSPEQIVGMMDYGFAPWWTYTGMRGAFWRPLTSMTHWLDYTLWPQSPSLMHLQSILWYAGAVMLVALLYRRLMGLTLTAGLAALLYAIDDAHSLVVGFLANRNALLAVSFGVLALMAHDRWRREGWRYGAFAGPLLLTLSLLSKEAGIATCAYLAAHALFIDRGTWRRRCLSLAPYAIVVVVWRMIWSGLGYGVANVALYVDPLADPARFAFALFERAPLLLLGQWTGPPAELTSAYAQHRPLIRLAVIAILVSVAVMLVPLFKRDRMARFWTVGMMLSIIPACTAFPADRLLMFPGIGAMALVAQYLILIRENVRNAAARHSPHLPARTLAWLLIIAHLIIAPLTLPVRSAWFFGPRWLRNQLRPAGPLDPSINHKDLIIVNPPDAFVLMESPLIWAAEGHPMPRHMRTLVSSRLQPVMLYREDARTLVVRPEAGFLAGLMDPLMRGPDHPLRLGQTVELPGMTVTITELTEDNRPAEAVFVFPFPLEHDSLHWLKWHNGRFVLFDPPPVGESITLPADWNIMDKFGF